MIRLLATTIAIFTLGACTTGVSWRSYQSSDYLDVQREVIGQVHIRLEGVPLVDCIVCLSTRNWYARPCVKIDASGLFHKEASRAYTWLQDLECKIDGGKTVSRVFSFPYYLSDTRAPNYAHYLGDIEIDLGADGSTAVSIKDDLPAFLEAWRNRSQPPLKLRVNGALLKLQENAWVEEQKPKAW